MSKKLFLIILCIIAVEVIFGFFYTRYCNSISHPIISYVQLVVGFVCGFFAGNYYKKYIKS